MDGHADNVNYMASIPDLTTESIMDHQTLPENHGPQNQVTTEILDASHAASKQADTATSLFGDDAVASGSTYQHVATISEPSTHVLEVGRVESLAAAPDVHDYAEFDDPGGEYMNIDEAAPLLDENGLAQLVKDLAREVEMDTEPSAGHSVIDVDLASAEPEAVDQIAIETEQAPLDPATDTEKPAAEQLRRTDDETIPVTAHHKDSLVDILDSAPPVPVAEVIELNDAGEQAVQDTAMPSEEPLNVPELETASTEILAEPFKPNTLRLEHIQVVEPAEPMDGLETVGVDDEVSGPVQITIESTTEEVGPAAVETEDLLPLPAIEVEPISAISTELAIENDPALETATSTTTEDVIAPIEPSTESDLVPPETETTVNTTTTITTNIVVEAETTNEESGLGASADADADADDDQAEHMRRAEQTRLEQGGEDVVMQHPEMDVQESGETKLDIEIATPITKPVEEDPAPKDKQASSEQPEQGQEGEAGPIDPATESSPTLVPPNDNSITRASESSAVSDVPPIGAPPEMPRPSKSPEWQGFAALGEEAEASPEFPDHSSETHEESPDSPEINGASTSQSSPPADSANAKRKRKFIMEVVIPISSKDTGKGKAVKHESPGPVTRGRSKPKPAGSARSSSTSKPRTRSRSSGRREPVPVSPASSHSSSGESTSEKIAIAQTRKRNARRPFNARPRNIKKPGKPTPTKHVAHSTKVEVVMHKRPGLLRRTGSIASGNNVKFAPTTRSSKKRKAESEPEDEPDHQGSSSDADAEGEMEEGYEDVEEDEELEPVPVPKPKPKAEPGRRAGLSKPVKRPRRSIDARKTPTKLPEVLTDSGRPKKRRTRR